MTETETLRMVRQKYGSILMAVGAHFGHRPEVMAGLLMRETRGGTSPLLVDENHTPDNPADDVGDGGHGHGLFQIDDRWHPEFCTGEDWKDPYKNAAYAGGELRSQRNQVLSECKQFKVPATPAEIERMAIAAYNCGADKVVHALRNREDLDKYTTGGDYSADVLRYAGMYQKLGDATGQG